MSKKKMQNVIVSWKCELNEAEFKLWVKFLVQLKKLKSNKSKNK